MDSIAGILLGLIAAGLLLALATGGPAGAKIWWDAKFLGKAA